jgi:hypothetical protein
MEFYIETVTGDLILIKTNTFTPPPCPIIAKSIKPVDAWLTRFILWLAVLIAPAIPHWPPPIWVASKARFAVLTIVFIALVEVLAQNHIESIMGAVA